MHKTMNECFEYQHTVTDGEIDEQGHANNVVFVAWMQAAAIAHTKALGWTSEKYKQLGGAGLLVRIRSSIFCRRLRAIN